MKNKIIPFIAIIVLQFAGLWIYNSLRDDRNQNPPSNSQIVAAVKNDPELLKQLREAVSESDKEAITDSSQATESNEADSAASSDSPGETGSLGETGSQGATGPRGTSGQNGDAGTNGQNGSNASLKLNNVVAPRNTLTTITDDQVKSGLMISVAPSNGTNEDRPAIVLPDPVSNSSLVGYTVNVVAEPQQTGLQRFGASIGYPGGTPAFLGDFLTLSPTDINFSDTPLTIIYEVNGAQKQSTLTEDYSSQPSALFGDMFGEAYVEGSIDIIQDYNRPGNNPNYNFAVVTKETGEQASISIIDPGAGDPLDLGSLTATPGYDVYLGYDGNELGIGELNAANPVGSGWTHTWPDQPYGIEQQALIMIATPSGWRATKTPYRSEFINYFSPGDKFLASNDKDLDKVIDKFDQEIFDLRARVDALEP